MSEIKAMILESIDTLRRRKARPDIRNICHVMGRRYGMPSSEVKLNLESLVNAEFVLRVDYKGSTSYRNASKWCGRDFHQLSGQVMNSTVISNSLVETVESLTNNFEDTAGACANAIEKLLLSNKTKTKLTRESLRTALEREVVYGNRLRRLGNGNFILREPPKPKQKEIQSTPLERPFQQLNSKENSCSSGKSSENRTDSETSFASPQLPFSPSSFSDFSSADLRKAPVVRKKPLPVPVFIKDEDDEADYSDGDFPTKKNDGKRGRPTSKRKRFKKYHGPDFVDTASLTSLDGFDCEDELLCDYCLMPSVSNPEGEPEELLVCKDCSAKAHPSCMDYSPELAKRSLLSPWQCMSCKICAVCQDPENGECMLFCDACDKGYHMSCHKPRIVGKPTGKWVCFQCNEESQPASTKVAVPKNNSSSLPAFRSLPMRPENEMSTAGLPTPCDSPVSDFEGSMGCDAKPNLQSSLKESALALYPQTIPDAKDWSIDDVSKFFASVGFPEQAPAFKDQEIDGRSLLLMKRSDVLTGMSLRLGPALKIYNHIKRLQTGLPD